MFYPICNQGLPTRVIGIKKWTDFESRKPIPMIHITNLRICETTYDQQPNARIKKNDLVLFFLFLARLVDLT